MARCIAQTHGPTSAVALQVVERYLFWNLSAVNGHHEIESVALFQGVAHEVEKTEGFLVVADQIHYADCHGTIACPRVAVIPIALAVRDDG